MLILDERMTAEKAVIMCAPWSVHFVPKALGEKMDIDENLKARIARTQAPISGAAGLAAKTYHINGSALMACEFRAQSPLGASSVLLNPIAARIYRGMRLRERGIVNSNGSYSRSSPFELKDLTEEHFKKIQKQRPTIPRCKIDENGGLSSDREMSASFGDVDSAICLSYMNKFNNEETRKIRSFEECVRRTNSEDFDKIRKCLTRDIEFDDAALLASKWYSHYDISGVGPIVLPARSKRPEHQQAAMSALAMGGFPSPFATQVADRCEVKGWSFERCEKALRVLDSWEVDFEWTQAQHFLGAKFAVRNCRTLRNDESLESLACKALKGSSTQKSQDSAVAK